VYSKKLTSIVFIFTLFISTIQAQESSFSINIKLTVAESIKDKVKPNGRLFVFLSNNSRREPRTQTWPAAGNYMFAKNIEELDANEEISISASSGLQKTATWSLNEVPEGTYYLQLLWDQDKEESRIDAPGNIYSKVEKVEVTESKEIEISLSEIIEPRTIVDHKHVKEVTLKSETLSKWWGKDMTVKASVLLPGSFYDEPNATYPVRYNIAGYGGRYTRINRIISNKSFSDKKRFLKEKSKINLNLLLDEYNEFGPIQIQDRLDKILNIFYEEYLN